MATASSSNETYISASSTQTIVTYSQLSHTWKISNFIHCRNGSLRSSNFYSDPPEDIKWNLIIYPVGYTSSRHLRYDPDIISDDEEDVYYNCCYDGTEFVVLGIETYVPAKNLTLKGKVTFSILDAQLNKALEVSDMFAFVNRKQFNTITSEWEHVAQTFTKRFNDALTRFDLFHHQPELLPNGELTILCEMQLTKTTEIVGPSYAVSEHDALEILSANLGSLLSDDKFSDVTVYCSRNREFKAHKSVLGARSQVFKAMFEHQMEENAKNRIEIKDFSPKIVQEMLCFIYTGKAPNLAKMADQLLVAADKYMLTQLKLMCEHHLVSILTVWEAPRFLVLADLHSADYLRAKVSDFIYANACFVTETENWKTFAQSHPQILLEHFVSAVVAGKRED